MTLVSHAWPVVLWLSFFCLTTPHSTTLAQANAPSSTGAEAVPPAVSSEQEPGSSTAQTAEQPSLEEDDSLADIRDYEIQVGELGRSTSTAILLEEAVNPFPARKTGRIHGSFYEFHRNEKLDARNFFDPVGEPLPKYRRNQFGFSVGGTVIRNLNFMGAFDGLRIEQGSTLVSHIPRAEMRRGDFSSLLERETPVQLVDPLTGIPFPENRIPEERFSPVSRRMLALLPEPNRDDPDRNYLNNEAVIRNRDSYNVRTDYQFPDNSKVSVRYALGRGKEFLVHPLPAFGTHVESKDQDASVGYNRSLTKRLLADAQFRYVRSRGARLSENANTSGLLASLGIMGLTVSDASEEGYPEFALTGYSNFGDRNSPVTSVYNGFSFDADLTYALPRHTLRFGGDIRARQFNNYRSAGLGRGRFVFNGYYSGDAFADFLLGIPESASRAMGSDRIDLRSDSWRLYFRDSWKLHPKLNISFRMSYDYAPPYSPVHANVSTFYPLIMDPPLEGEIVVTGSSRASQLGLTGSRGAGFVRPDKNNFGPYIGISYNPLGSNEFVLRSYYVIDYDSLGAGYYINQLGRNYPFYYVENAQASIDNPVLNLLTPFETAIPAELSVRGIEADIQSAYIQSWRVSVESEILRSWNFSMSYAGSKGTSMPRTVPGNVPLPGPGTLQPRRPNPAFGRFSILTSGGSYSQNMFELDAERRLVGGFSAKPGFRWNRLFSDTFFSPANPRDLKAERAPAGYIPTRSFFMRYILDVPFGKGRFFGPQGESWIQWMAQGWQLSGTTHIQDGTPFSVFLAGDLNNDGLTGERPDRLGPGALPGSNRSIDRWFAIEHFAEPAPYSFGNAGKNILMSPAYQNWDISVIKQTRFSDGKQVELRVELFNAFNKVNFEEPYAVFGNPLFGKIFGAGRSREIEVAVKYSF
jgi:hypothetical protein